MNGVLQEVPAFHNRRDLCQEWLGGGCYVISRSTGGRSFGELLTGKVVGVLHDEFTKAKHNVDSLGNLFSSPRFGAASEMD